MSSLRKALANIDRMSLAILPPVLAILSDPNGREVSGRGHRFKSYDCP